MGKIYFSFFVPLLFTFCNHQQKNIAAAAVTEVKPQAYDNPKNLKVIHVFVALCDNKYQGIVPVPAKIGNGQEPANNLYWGCKYGVKAFFAAQQNWQLLSTTKSTGGLILERLVFKYRTKEIYMIADAYDGKEIKSCTINFLKSCSGNVNDSIRINNKTIYCGGASEIISYIGHNGLMDFTLSESFKAADHKRREVMIYACISKKYFAEHIKAAGAIPVVWTSGLCSPEAYSLASALESRIANEPIEKAALRSAEAYSKYQKCSMRSAQKLMICN